MLLTIFASLRFADTREISELWVTKSAVCGISVDQKAHGGELMNWAAPRWGLRSDGA